MEEIKKNLASISMISLITLLIASYSLKWPVLLAFIAIAVQDVILMLLYLYTTKVNSSLCFRVGSVCLWGIALIAIQLASYGQNIGFIKWCVLVIKNEYHSIWGYELGTILISNYILMYIGVIGKSLRNSIRKQIYRWLPASWLLILVICQAFLLRGELVRSAKLMTTIGSLALLVMLAIMHEERTLRSKQYYSISGRGYIKLFVIFGVTLVFLLSRWSPEQDLPGANWVQGKIEMIGYVRGNQQKHIPDKSPITEGMSLSSDVLFEVTAQEPLYLREIAYSEYEDSEWYISKDAHALIPFKPVYLEAEYNQLDWLLEEIEWVREQDKSLLVEYADLLNYDKSPKQEKVLYISSGPRVLSNYYTVNGVKQIKSDYEKNIYYYHKLDNIYFRCSLPKSNISYSVSYYKRVPEPGSREYQFLKRMNAEKWNKLYRVIEGIKGWYNYDKQPTPTLLQIYTPLRQYEEAKATFTNVPSDLDARLRALALTITDLNDSDWDKAQQIEAYLRDSGKYTYNLEAKRKNLEVDPVYEFLFESREGICQDFASSMVLMCRSIGLPARYVTGYLVTEKNSKTDKYIVRKKDAHAFVEVYIAGYGWMQFDPTPADVEETGKLLTTLSMPKHLITKSIEIMIVLVTGMIGYIIFRLNYECIWIYVTFKKSPDEAIYLIIKRMLLKLEHKGIARQAGETLEQYEKRLNGCNLTMQYTIKIYSDYKYGDIVPNVEQIREALDEYKVLCKKLKNI